MVVGMTTAVTPASRQPDGETDEDDDGSRRQAEVEQELVGFLVGGRAIVAGHRPLRLSGRSDPLSASTRASTACETTTALAPLRLAMARLTAGASPALTRPRIAPGAGLILARRLDHLGDVTDIDALALGGGQGQQPDLGGVGQGSSGRHIDGLAAVADLSGGEGPVDLAYGVHQRRAIPPCCAEQADRARRGSPAAGRRR